MRIVVIIPAKDEAAPLQQVLTQLQQLAAQHTNIVLSIYVMDNGSADTTAQVAKKSGATVIDCKHLVGKPRVVQHAFNHVPLEHADYVVICDADGQHPPVCVIQMILAHIPGTISKGTRFGDEYDKNSIPEERIRLQQESCNFFQKHYGHAFTDPQCGLIVMDVGLVKEMSKKLRFDGPSWELELLMWLCQTNQNSLIKEIPIPPVYTLGEAKQRKKYSDDEGAKAEREQRIIDHLEFLQQCLNRYA